MAGVVDDIGGIRRILLESRSIAVVGLSADWHRPSNFAAKYLMGFGYRVHPVNPRADSILGVRSHPSLSEIPEPVDVVDCFRRAGHAPALAREAVEIGAKTLWLQLGVASEEAARIATEGGLDVVMDRCMKIEHGRLFGGLNWVGVNTRVISARKRVPFRAPPTRDG